jgi:hypothetical protein
MLLLDGMMRTGTDVHSEAEAVSAKAVEAQLRRLQESPLFSHGRRSASFLEYVIRKTLEGHADELKERLVGVEAFGRPAEYDLNADPVVRVTASDVRKRLAQYYYDPAHQDELRIELRPGAYVPSFRYAKETPVASEEVGEEVVASTVAMELTPRLPVEIGPGMRTAVAEGQARRWKAIAVACGLALVATLAWALLPRTVNRSSALDAFWRPVTQASGPVLISVGNVVAMVNNGAIAPAPFTISGHPLASDPIAVSDAQAMSTIQQVLSEQAKESVLQSSTSTTFSDLQKGPDVLISGFNNPWTMRITDPLRFHFVRNSFHVYSIEDRSNAKHSWTVDTANSFEQMNYDYGLAARFHDPITGQVVVVVAGLGENGTVAAGRFVAGEKYMEDLKKAKQFPRGDQNFEAVVASQIIDGKPGPPRVVDTYSW